MKTVLSLSILLLSLGAQLSFAQASLSTEFTFTGPSNWYAERLARGSDGQILQLLRQQPVGSFNDQTLLLSTDTLGQLNWIRSWGNEGEILRPRHILTRPNGEIIVAATYFNPFQGGAEMALLYLAADGSFQRQAVYATAAAENIWDLALAENGNLLILGDISADGGIASLLMEINSQGEVLRQLSLKNDLFTYYTHLTRSPDGGLFLSGQDGISGESQSIISRLDANWNVLWTTAGRLDGKQVSGYDIISVDPTGASQQFIEFEGALWLVGYDPQGNVTQERWLGVSGRPEGFTKVGDHYLFSTVSGILMELSAEFELLSFQYRSSDTGGLTTAPVRVDNASIVTIGHTLNEDGQFIILQQKGAANLAPGCVGYNEEISAEPIGGLIYEPVNPTITTTNLSLGTLDLAFGTPPSPAIVNTCTQSCPGDPSANFNLETNGLSLNITVDEVVADTDYEWELSNGESYFGSNLAFTLTAEGNYELCLTTSNDCGQSQACQSFSVTINSTQGVPSQALGVVPNPVTTECLLRGLLPGRYQLTIHDALGQLIHREERFFSATPTLSLNHLPAGPYFLQLTNQEQRYLARLIKS